MLYKRLRFCRTFLRNVRDERDEVGVLICHSAIFICSLHQTDVAVSDLSIYVLLERLELLGPKVNDQLGICNSVNSWLLERLQLLCTKVNNQLAIGNSVISWLLEKMKKSLQVSDNTHPLGVFQKDEVTSVQKDEVTHPLIDVFQNDEVTSVLHQLTGGSKQLRVVPIIGMAGLGKTTFTLELYNHPSVAHHFHARAWCPISQVMDLKKVLLQLSNQIQPGQDCSKMTEEDLADNLRKNLKGKRYLIFLDDVWTTEAWNILAMSFPNDSTRSRVVLTSRKHNIIPHGLLGGGKPYSLRVRGDNECFKILEAKVFHGNGNWGLLTELGMKFAEKCKGLPLTAVIVAGLLANTEQDDWNSVLDSLSLGVVSGVEQCNKALELSYKNLPDYLRPCFLYSCAFPEDEDVSVKRLIQYWIAEGLVKKQEVTGIQDVGREYLEKLVERSLVMVVQKRSTGTGTRTCRIHDVLRDFGLEKAKQESFFQLLQGRDQLSDFNEEPSLQRLCIHSEPILFKRSKLFCPRAASLLFFCTQQPEWDDPLLIDISFIIQTFKMLKVLDIGQIRMPTGLPSDIELLTRLTYLSIQIEMCDIPSPIGTLSNLETFICHTWASNVTLPPTLWSLQKLNFLHISGYGVFDLPMHLGNPLILPELETLRGVLFYSNGSMETQVMKFPNIRRLKCKIIWDCKSPIEMGKIVVPVFLDQLQSLTVYGHDSYKFEIRRGFLQT